MLMPAPPGLPHSRRRNDGKAELIRRFVVHPLGTFGCTNTQERFIRGMEGGIISQCKAVFSADGIQRLPDVSLG